MIRTLTPKNQGETPLDNKHHQWVIKVSIAALNSLHEIISAKILNPYTMIQLGGAWIGHRYPWADIKDSEIRLEVFFNTPPQLLEHFNHQFELTYPEQLGTSLHPKFSIVDSTQVLIIGNNVVAFINKKRSESNQVLMVEVSGDPTTLTKNALNYLLKMTQEFCQSHGYTSFEVYVTLELDKLPLKESSGLTIKKYNLRYQEYIICGDLSTKLHLNSTEQFNLSTANKETNYYQQYVDLKQKLTRQRITFALRDTENTFLGFAVFEVPANILNMAHLGMLFLDPAIRGTGHGAKLLSTVESYLEHIDICNIRLTSPHFMAHTFYPRQGYSEMDRMPWPRENLYLFFKPLQSRTGYKEATLCSPREVALSFIKSRNPT